MAASLKVIFRAFNIDLCCKSLLRNEKSVFKNFITFFPNLWWCKTSFKKLQRYLQNNTLGHLIITNFFIFSKLKPKPKNNGHFSFQHIERTYFWFDYFVLWRRCFDNILCCISLHIEMKFMMKNFITLCLDLWRYAFHVNAIRPSSRNTFGESFNKNFLKSILKPNPKKTSLQFQFNIHLCN